MAPAPPYIAGAANSHGCFPKAWNSALVQRLYVPAGQRLRLHDPPYSPQVGLASISTATGQSGLPTAFRTAWTNDPLQILPHHDCSLVVALDCPPCRGAR